MVLGYLKKRVIIISLFCLGLNTPEGTVRLPTPVTTHLRFLVLRQCRCCVFFFYFVQSVCCSRFAQILSQRVNQSSDKGLTFGLLHCSLCFVFNEPLVDNEWGYFENVTMVMATKLFFFSLNPHILSKLKNSTFTYCW